MSFTTLKFLIFFAIVFWGYFLIPKRFQWAWLLVGSLVFYAFSAWWAIFYLLGTITVSYGCARWIQSLSLKQKESLVGVKDKNEKSKIKASFERKKKWVVVLALVLLVGLLVVVKYTNFILKNVESVFHLDSFALDIVMPVGLSFYIFQNIGYLIDVYRGQYEAEKNYFKFALYISYFPHVLQGPLDDYEAVSAELYGTHEFDYARVVSGAKRAAWGFFKKLVIANQISVVIDGVIKSGGTGHEGLSIMLSVVLYAFWIYADFSGYMDMAIGMSKMLGIPIAENFDSPYLSKNIAEYWRRWHITLGAWFRNYVFYSVLRSSWCTAIRKKFKKSKYLASTVPTVLALAIVWLLIGMWHGAAWSYIMHGIYHGGFIILGTILDPVYDKLHKKFPKFYGSKFMSAFRVVRTFTIVTIGYYFFATGAPSLSLSLLKGSCHIYLAGFVQFLSNNLRELIIIGISLIFLIYMDFYNAKGDKPPLGDVVARQKTWVRWTLYFVLLFAILFFRAYDVGDAFAYFRF
ncbi:MAG: MBOAT family protein [Clostridia bacterium]|nr:MBOAT family protein [Clostridia bacterium]